MRKLSSERMESFVGNVLPLRLLGGEACGMEDITWKAEGDCVILKRFVGAPNGIFDFVEGYTVHASTGRIIFPTVEPFGSSLKKKIGNAE